MVMRNRRRVEYRFGYNSAGVAQLVEQLICNQQVIGSSPIASSSRVVGQVAKRSNASDCKSDGSCLRRFESSPAHGVLQDWVGRLYCLRDELLNELEWYERGSNSVGRVTAFQAVGRGFESRLPLHSV
jgi:hypothetical protein